VAVVLVLERLIHTVAIPAAVVVAADWVTRTITLLPPATATQYLWVTWVVVVPVIPVQVAVAVQVRPRISSTPPRCAVAAVAAGITAAVPGEPIQATAAAMVVQEATAVVAVQAATPATVAQAVARSTLEGYLAPAAAEVAAQPQALLTTSTAAAAVWEFLAPAQAVAVAQ
jgi:hypothetical protein